jgi:apolipoprotein N-acyltransferase
MSEVAAFFAMIVLFVLYLALTYWAYADASDRGMDVPGFAAALVFFGGLPGLIIYLLIRPEKTYSPDKPEWLR